MVYQWDTLTDKQRDIFSLQYINSHEGYRIPVSQATLKFQSCTLASKSLCSLWTLRVGGVPPDVQEACKDINV